MSAQQRTIIIGAGYAGLTAAALLAKSGREVLLLESHDTLGGCASFFKRGQYTFDVGATTIAGLGKHQPAGRVFDHLGISPNVIRQDPGMLIRTPTVDVVRHADKQTWIREVQRLFPDGDQEGFWNKLYDLESSVWGLIGGLTHFPPAQLSDYLTLLSPSALKGAPLATGLIRPVDVLMERYKVHRDPAYRDFIDEQLLISTQNTSSAAPYVTGAMGLTYPSDTYYPMGGMYRPALQLMRSASANGAEIKFRRRVTSVTQHAGTWQVACANGESYTGSNVISSIPIWNMPAITEGRVTSWYEKKGRRFDDVWCAVTAYFVLEGVPKLPGQYVQLHLDEPVPHVHSKSLFLTISHPDDREKAPLGHSTVTVSTHARADDWKGLTEEAYREQKQRVHDHIMRIIMRRMPEFAGMMVSHEDAGTPKTWVDYTQRYDGYVGGIPHNVTRPLVTLPPNQTPFRGLYHIGDSAFPGQGTPAVMLSAWNTVQRIFDA
jgi:C-3',4' desaturase CrtD